MQSLWQMFLQVWPSGSSHEEAHLERVERRATPQSGGKKKSFEKGRGRKKKVNKRRLPTSLLVELSQSRVAGECSSQSMPFCTILKPSASGTSLRRKALWRSSVATRGQNHGWASFFFCRFFLFVFFLWFFWDWEGLKTHTDTHKKTKN